MSTYQQPKSIKSCPVGLVLAALMLSVWLPGCSWLWGGKSDEKKEKEPEATELTTDSVTSIDLPESELFESAKRQYSSGLFTIARDSFEALRNQYPVGAYAEFAEIKAADTYFEARDYATAAMLYEEFTKNHPASNAVPYMLLRAGRSHQLSQRGVGRDRTALYKAREIYSRLIGQYPESLYAESAKVYQQESDEKIAAHEKMVIEFYKRQGMDAAWRAREERFQKNWGRASEEFSGQVDESYLEARISERDTERNASPPLLEQAPITSITDIQNDDIEIFDPAQDFEHSKPHKSMVRAAECNATSRSITLFLDHKLKDLSALKSHRITAPSNGVFYLSLPELAAPTNSTVAWDCFGSKDLSITGEGKLSIAAAGSELKLVDLDHPPRLLMIIR